MEVDRHGVGVGVGGVGGGMLYHCPHCTRGFKRELAFDRHVAVCAFMSRSARKRKQDDTMAELLPTMKDMFHLVVEMTAKQSQLERKVEELTKWVETKKKKLDILDWLAQHRAHVPLSFPAWVSTVEQRVTRQHLEFMFSHDYIQGVGQIIRELLPGLDGGGGSSGSSGSTDAVPTPTPLAAFNVNDNILYFYSAQSQWELLPDEIFRTLTNAIYRGILDQLMLWQQENRWRMHHDAFSTIYANNIKTVMGSSMSHTTINNRIRRDLYTILKINVRTITEVELSF